LLRLAPVIINKNIPHDRVQPCFDICSNVIFILIGYRPVQCFLKKIFRFFAIPGQSDRKRLQKFSIGYQQLIEFKSTHDVNDLLYKDKNNAKTKCQQKDKRRILNMEFIQPLSHSAGRMTDIVGGGWLTVDG
jgi:hypothetical protein